MACTLRDQTLSLVLIAALLTRYAEAAPLVVDNAHLTLHRPQELLFHPDLPSAGNLTVAQAEQAAASLATSWSLTSPSAFAQLAGWQRHSPQAFMLCGCCWHLFLGQALAMLCMKKCCICVQSHLKALNKCLHQPEPTHQYLLSCQAESHLSGWVMPNVILSCDSVKVLEKN